MYFWLRGIQGVGRSERNGNKAFVMRISDDELDDKEEAEARSLVPVGRFACDDIYLRYYCSNLVGIFFDLE